MPSALNLAQGGINPPRPDILYGQVSTSQPAPASFASTLFVVFPQWDTDYNWQFADWPACHGSTLPAQGATVIVVRDDQRNLRVVWWDSATTVFAATSIGSGVTWSGDLSGSGQSPTVAKVNGTTVPLTGAAWIAPTLINSWANVAGGATVAGYFRDPLGMVHLRGRVAGGASGSVAFVLPANYRPGGGQDFYPATAYNGTTAVAAFAAIDTSGNAELFSASGATQVALGAVTFLAEN